MLVANETIIGSGAFVVLDWLRNIFVAAPQPVEEPEIGSVQTRPVCQLLAHAEMAACRALPVGRYRHTATHLGNGRVLVVGGRTGTGILDDCGIYHSATDSWSQADSLSRPRCGHWAFSLPDGRVTVIGGENGTPHPTGEVEIYDPDTNTWSFSAPWAKALEAAAATQLGDGSVLVVGGYRVGYKRDVYRFDWQAGEWTRLGMMHRGRSHHSMCTLFNGKVLVTGGEGAMELAELYDPETNRWSSLMMTGAWRHHHTLPLPGERAMLIGKEGMLHFDGAEFHWMEPPPEATERNTARSLIDGKILVCGGESENARAEKRAFVFAPDTLDWTETEPMSEARAWHTATELDDGSILLVGGAGLAGNALTSVDRFYPGESYVRRSAEFDASVPIEFDDTEITDMGELATSARFEPLEIIEAGSGPVMVAAGGGCFAWCTTDRDLHVRQPEGNPRIAMRVPMGEDLRAIAMSPDGRWVALGGKGLVVMDAASGQIAYDNPDIDTRGLTALAFSHDGQWLATGGSDREVLIFAVNGWTRVLGWSARTPGRITDLIWSSDDNLVLASNDRGSVTVHDATTGERRPDKSEAITGFIGPATCLALTRDLQTLIVGEASSEQTAPQLTPGQTGLAQWSVREFVTSSPGSRKAPHPPEMKPRSDQTHTINGLCLIDDHRYLSLTDHGLLQLWSTGRVEPIDLMDLTIYGDVPHQIALVGTREVIVGTQKGRALWIKIK